MTTHELAKLLLDKEDVSLKLFYGLEKSDENTQDKDHKLLSGPFNICYAEVKEGGKIAMIMPLDPEEEMGKPQLGITRATIKKLFKESELDQANLIKRAWEADESADTPSLADRLEEMVVTEKKIKYINHITGGENIRRYWAYALEAYLSGALQ